MTRRIHAIFTALALVLPAAVAEPYPPNHPNLWGRSIASQSGTFGLWSNPATIPVREGDQRFSLTSGLGAYYNDSDEVVEASERVEEESRELEQTAQQRPLLPGDAQPLIDAFKNLEGRVLTAGGGGGVFIPLRNLRGWDLLAGFNVGNRTATSFDFDPRDEQTLETAFVLGAFRSNDLVSRLIASGVTIESMGLSAARTFGGRGPDSTGYTRVGITIKNQEITLYNRAIPLSNFEEGELTQTHRNVKRFNHPNMDVGMIHRWRNWHVSGVLSNVNGRNFLAQGAVYEQGPGLNLALGYSGAWGALQVDVDALSRQPGYGTLTDERRVRLGVAIPVFERFQLRGAYHRVITGRDADAAVFGLGWRVSESLQLQSALLVAGKDELGLSMQMTLAL